MTGFLRIGVDVEHRRVVERDADGGELARERAAESFGQRLGAGAAEHRHRRPARERLLQPRDAAALLVDADPRRHRAPERLDLSGELGDLLRRLDVAAEENRAAEIELARQRAQLRRDRRSREAADQQLADLTSGGRRHVVPKL